MTARTLAALPLAATLAFLTSTTAHAGRGGPDGGGWSWVDSFEPGVDVSIESTLWQTPITPGYPDESVFAVNLSFPFTLYGTTSQTVWVSTNGWLSLIDPGANARPAGVSIPTPGAPDALVAFYWSDLELGTGSFLYHGQTPNGHRVMLSARDKVSGGTVEAVIQFQHDGSLKVVWYRAPMAVTASIGIENGAGAAGTRLQDGRIASPGFQLGPNYAVLFYPAAVPDCAGASTLACSGAAAATTAGPASRVLGYGCSPSAYAGGERVFTFTTTGAGSMIASLTGLGGRDLDLFLMGGSCDSRFDCIAGGSDTVSQPLLGPGTYYLVVDGKTAADDGPFNLTATCGAIGLPIDCGQSGVPNSPVGPNLIDTYDCGLGGTYPQSEAYYRFTAPFPVSLTATLGSTTPWDLALFRAADLPNTCIAAAAGNVTGFTLINVPAGDYVLVVDARTLPSDPVSLSLACVPFITTPLACDATLPGRTGGSSVLDAYPCFAGTRPGGDALFTFDNPVQQDLAFGLSGVPASAELDVAILDNQAAFPVGQTPCLAGADTVVRLANAPAGPYLVSVDAQAVGGDVPFLLSAACGASTLDCTAAPDLACNSLLQGDTTGGSNTAALYGSDDSLYTGPERIYHLSNPVLQPVHFLLRSADPRLDLILLDACGAGSVLDQDDSAIVLPSLPPGDYWLVVDGREEAASPFELVTFCGGAELRPPVLVQALDPGACHTETKTLFFPPFDPDADVVFSLDRSSSMVDELARLQAGSSGLFAALAARTRSLAVGLASFVEYEQCYNDTVCGRGGCPTTSEAYPFRVDEPLTTDHNQVAGTLGQMTIAGGGKETYTRSFFESYTDPTVGWRDCASRVWVSVGDEAPVDCNAYACIGGLRNEGRDPGPDLLTGTADDLELMPTVDAMAANSIALVPFDSSEAAQQQAMWDCLAQRTGAKAVLADRFGALLPGSDLVSEITRAVIGNTRNCPDLRLVATGPDAPWVRVTPAALTDALTPFHGEFDVTYCVPPGAGAGPHDITIEARCVGRGGCAPTLLATQAVTIEVNPSCQAAPAAAAGQDVLACQNDPVRLDGSGSTQGSCPTSPLYEWREGAVVLSPASPTPTFDAPTGAIGSTTYTLVVSCPALPGCEGQDQVTVTVEVCGLAVRFGDVDAIASTAVDGGAIVDLTFTTVEELDTIAFQVERSGSEAGSWQAAGMIPAKGPSAYAFRDRAGREGDWYRLRELTGGGPGTLSPAVRARSPLLPEAGSTGRGRARSGRRPGR